jgi:hypothetical protein
MDSACLPLQEAKAHLADYCARGHRHARGPAPATAAQPHAQLSNDPTLRIAIELQQPTAEKGRKPLWLSDPF